MKITIYELLGMVKDGKAPKKVKYSGIEYEFNGKDYINEFGVNLLQHLTYAEYIMTHKVEILEEEKKIPEKITINENGTIGFPNGQWTARNMDKAFAVKINSIIDYLKSKGDE